MSTTRTVGDVDPLPDAAPDDVTTRRRATPDWRSWVAPIAIYLVVRGVGILTLIRFDALRGRSLRESLSAWDGEWMLAIAEHGYAGVPFDLTDARGIHTADTALAFFPGYPYLVRAVASLPLISPYGAAVGINLLLGCVAAVGVARLGELCVRAMRGRSPIVPGPDATGPGRIDTARVGLFLVALFAATPMSVVLNMAYTETLFCTLSVWALVGVLRRQWVLAGICAALVGTVRPTAVVVIGVVMLAVLIDRFGPGGERRRADDGSTWQSVVPWIAFVISPVGYLGYLGYVWSQTGSPTGWFAVQTEGWDTRFDGGVAAFNFVNDMLVNSDGLVPVAVSWIIVITLVLIAVAVWARLPWPVLVYGILVVASIVLSSGLMMSRPRLLLPAFVLLVPAAIGLARCRPRAGIALLIPIVIGSSWFGAYMLTVYPHAM
ncbi:hypothetical protein [Gordonia desulfuricans]|uniref:hypothetical protein n=1 Tax=Gordonia desulfuricans TaxID=89051 RepID=UPI000A8106C5|nr:hypothetical protein [Gordonia desulfuricans]